MQPSPWLAALLACACGGQPGAEAIPHQKPGARPLVEVLAPLAVPLPPPGPMDWLAQHEEPGQTLAQYVRSTPPLPTPGRTTLYVLPLGHFEDEERAIVDLAIEYLGLYYGLPVKALDPAPLSNLPGEATREDGSGFGPQVHSGWILNELLRPALPEDGAAILGLTAMDLWPGRGWNFVFGEASIARRVGVWSMARYGDPSDSAEARTLALVRTLKVASHETGHMFGLLHCTAWSCSMNGSNHLGETDSTPMQLCPTCTTKVVWGTGVNPVERAAGLAAFGERNGLPQSAVSTWTRSLARLRGDDDQLPSTSSRRVTFDGDPSRSPRKR